MKVILTAPAEGDPQAPLLRQASALLEKNDFIEADRVLGEVVQKAPLHLQALTTRGVVLLELGRPADALACFQVVAAQNRGDPRGDHNCGVALLNLGRYAEALGRFDRALKLDKTFVGTVYNRGVCLGALGRVQEAIAAYDQTLALQPDHAEALNNRSVAYQALGRPLDALADLDRAVKLRPDEPDLLNNRGNALRLLGRHEEALAAFDKAVAINPNHVSAHNNRGVALGALGRLEEALAAFDRAVELKADYPEAHENRGVMLTELGRPAEAAAAIDEAIRVAPRRVRGYYDLTETRKLKADDPRIPVMEDIASNLEVLNPTDQIEINFAIGKAYADLHDYERAFQKLNLGGRLKRARLAYDEKAVLDGMKRTAEAFTAETLWRSAGKGDPSTLPVFILGMPRSGSTLLEQILASHPQVFAAGETDLFRANLAQVVAETRMADTPEAFARLSGAILKRLGTTYLDKLRPLAGDAIRITDKSIEAFRFGGLIQMALPNTRFIHIKRDPMDTCVSCFTKLFVSDLPYTYDLAELGRYYRAYEELMAHWAKVFPEGSMIEVQYEDLVADLEGQARRIIAHVGLEWDPKCLDFHLNDRAIRTASFAQVRQPLYTSSIGRWRTYEPWLGPLKDALGAR